MSELKSVFEQYDEKKQLSKEAAAKLAKEIAEIDSQVDQLNAYKKQLRIERASKLIDAGQITEMAMAVTQAATRKDFSELKNKADQLARVIKALPDAPVRIEKQSVFQDYLDKASEVGFPGALGIDDAIKNKRGLYTVIGAREKTGKTTLLANLVYYYVQSGLTVQVFSFEQTEAEMYEKLAQIHCAIAGGGRVSRSDLKAMGSERFSKLFKVLESKLTFDFSAQFSMTDLLNRYALNYSDRKPPDVLFLDYVQRIKPDERGVDIRQSFISASRRLADLFLRDNNVGFVFSQLNQQGGYKESTNFGEDAGMNIILSRAGHELTIKVVNSRYYGDGEFVTTFDGKHAVIGGTPKDFSAR